MINILKFYDSLIDITNQEEVFNLLSEVVSECGFSYFWLMQTDNNLQQNNLLNLTNYPQDFIDEYLKTERVKKDPVVVNSFKKPHPLFWSEMFDNKFLNENFLEQLEWANQFKINSGISCPLFTHGNPAGLLHFALPTSSSEQLSQDESFRQQLEIFSALIFQKLNSLPLNKESHNLLSMREIDCLIWAARGKSAWETAQILSLSEHTVREYLVNAKNKLHANTITEAVIKAFLQFQFSPFNFILK